MHWVRSVYWPSRYLETISARELSAVFVNPTMCGRAFTAASFGDFTIDQNGAITALTAEVVLMLLPESGRSTGETAKITADKSQFNGVCGLRTHITFTRIGDRSSR